MSRVYVVLIRSEHGMCRVSQEAYATLEKAQSFIRRRSDRPRQVDDFNFTGRSYVYYIHELSVM